MNPQDNAANLSADYLATLADLPARMRARFERGEFRESDPNALFPDANIDKWRVTDGVVPDFVRVVVAVDPSGSDDEDNADNDEIGICVAGLGTDGNGYMIEDLTIKAGPGTWGRVATSAYERHRADKIVGEANYGGAMVKHVIRTANPSGQLRHGHGIARQGQCAPSRSAHWWSRARCDSSACMPSWRRTERLHDARLYGQRIAQPCRCVRVGHERAISGPDQAGKGRT